MSEPAVQVIQLSHRYDQSGAPTILDSLSLTIEVGETLALVGASGSGKSTLLNVIGGLEPVQSGSVTVFGQNLHEAKESTRTALRRNTIGFVYQAFNLIPTLTVFDNIRLPLALSGSSAGEQQARVDQLIDTVGLGARAHAFPDALSGGEQQRVALARAIVHRPPLLLADEPTGNLDANTGQQVMDLLKALAAEQNTTLLMVTHSAQVASSADRVLAMQDGRLIQPSTDAAGNTW